MTCYEIDEPNDGKRIVTVDNQFGEQVLEVSDAELLCVPSEKLSVVEDDDDDDSDDEDEDDD